MTGQHGGGHGGERVTLVLGAVLLVLGVLFLAGPALDIDVGELGWPVFVIVPGVALLVVGLLSSGPVGLGMTVAGSIVTVVGLILFYRRGCAARGHESAAKQSFRRCATWAPTSCCSGLTLTPPRPGAGTPIRSQR